MVVAAANCVGEFVNMQLSFSLIIQQRPKSLFGSKRRWGGGFVGDFSKHKRGQD